MIAFGSSITMPEVYERQAARGIARVAEPDAVILAHAAAGSIYRSYNLILDTVAHREDLEALVLLHQDAEIVDDDFGTNLRSVFQDPDVGVVGCVGATSVRGLAWWEGSVTWGSFASRYGEPGGGPPTLAWNGDELAPEARTGDVDVIDGFFMALSPWAVRNIRFDEALGLLVHGFDVDYCLQVRAAGKKVVAADLDVVHHHPIELVTNPEAWMEAHMTIADKWDDHVPVGNGARPEPDWRGRARRAEAEAGIARLQGASKLMQAYAAADIDAGDLERVTGTASWRLTEPLRRVNALRRARRDRS